MWQPNGKLHGIDGPFPYFMHAFTMHPVLHQSGEISYK